MQIGMECCLDDLIFKEGKKKELPSRNCTKENGHTSWINLSYVGGGGGRHF